MKPDIYSTLIEEGEYTAIYLREEHAIAFGHHRIFVIFQITTFGSAHGLPILRVYNKPKGGRLARSHNLSLDYMNVVGRRPPTKGLPPEKFLKDCEVRVMVTTVKHRIEGGKRIEIPPACRYSKVDRVMALTAGTPPCLADPARRRAR